MRGGDLSNDLAPAIGIRFERVLRTEEGRLNKAAKAFIERISSVDANIFIVTTGDRRKALAFLTKWRVLFSQVVQADSTLEIPDICREQDFITYYDLDKAIIQNLNTRGNKKTKGELWTLVEVSSLS